MTIEQRERWAPFPFVSFNRGDHARYRDVLGVLQERDGTPRVQWAGLQEMYDQQRTLNRIQKRTRWEVLRGTTKMSPLIYDPEVMELLEQIEVKLLPAGKRNGKHNMEKVALGGRFHHKPSDRKVICLNGHNIQTQYPKGSERDKAAILHNARWEEALQDRVLACFSVADWNAEWDGRSMAPWRDGDWQHTLTVPTIGKNLPKRGRAIDGAVWCDRDGTPIVRVDKTPRTRLIRGSDHAAVYIDAQLRIRSSKPRHKEAA